MGDFSDLAENILRKNNVQKVFLKLENITIRSKGCKLANKHSRKFMQ